MIKLIFTLLCFVSAYASSAQKAKQTDMPQTAAVEVVVKDPANKPRKGEEVMFIPSNNKKTISGRTNASGKVIVRLPVGNDYSIIIKAIADSNQYAQLSIPTLAAGETFTAPFEVEIIYEPGRSFTLDNVHFDNNKATLKPASFKELNELAEYMKWRDNEKIEIAGHTDNVGKDQDNLILSEKRAQAVREYLIKKGITAIRITAKGYGATQPVSDNSNDAGRQKNRRTEVRILE